MILALSASVAGARTYDVIVYGGTASGVVAAYSAARMGADVILVCPDMVLGGMTTGGLGKTDIGNKQAISGIARQFYRRLGDHYGTLEKWNFEPSAALEVIEGYVRDGSFPVERGMYLESVEKKGGRIRSVICSGKKYKARQYIDCSYEGDLMAAAGVEYATGREGSIVYGECYNGVQLMKNHQFPDGVDPYVEPGNPASGLLWGISDNSLKPFGSGDALIQAYNFRLCLTDEPSNRIPIEKPEGYDPSRYELLRRLLAISPQKTKLNDWFIWSRMPGHKTDVNNRGAFSTDAIGMSQGYPEASRVERERMVREHKDYTLGLLYFFGHDPAVPASLRSQMLKWGLPKDEYVDTGHWTHQLYVREARRMVGEYVATQADCEGRTQVEDGIAFAAYNMDSHNCQRIVVIKDGKPMVKNEGNVEIPGGIPYPVPYRCLTPKRAQCGNLLVPVCLSASHIAYGSIRMEPVFMATGQAAGMAAAISGRAAVQDLDVRALQQKLKEDPFLDGSIPDIYLDEDTPGIEISGWKAIRRKGSYGPTCFCLDPGMTGELKYSFPPELSGEFDLYAYVRTGKEFCGRYVYELEMEGGKTICELDTSNLRASGFGGSDWFKIGTFVFRPGCHACLRVLPADGDKPCISDAVMLKSK